MYKAIRPLLFLLSPDRAHHLVALIMEYGGKVPVLKRLEKWFRVDHPRLRQELHGILFSNPVGVAAGLDKNGKTVPFLKMLGFGFVEVGSVTRLSSQGNPLPRMKRLVKDGALINRCGLNNDGAEVVRKRLLERSHSIPLGVNIAKTHSENIIGADGVEDFHQSFELLKDCGHYITLNISCPNTTEGKTFESSEALHELLLKLKVHKISKPIFVKFSPGPSNQELVRLLEVCESFNVSGYILGNTATSRDELIHGRKIAEQFGRGGLSGLPLKERMFELVELIYCSVDRSKIIIACGGIRTAEDVYKAISLGAHLVQVLTGFVYEGPSMARTINRNLLKMLERDGVSVGELRGDAVVSGIV